MTIPLVPQNINIQSSLHNVALFRVENIWNYILKSYNTKDLTSSDEGPPIEQLYYKSLCLTLTKD